MTDDIRQDAIMQQVFVTVNFLLRNQVLTNGSMNIEAYQRILRLVTYNCIPLSPDSGVLEWVENTVPFGACLVGNRGMHNTYYPKEWDNYTCRKKLMEATDKREAFDEICENFSPAFRFFFLERFRGSTQLWHESRTRYVRSCAVSSMVGHILGIGDRHASNILMNEVTGELVHIDFGIVFEQGKVSVDSIIWAVSS
jgi:ataxia telangiectasia mutated family protein